MAINSSNNPHVLVTISVHVSSEKKCLSFVTSVLDKTPQTTSSPYDNQKIKMIAPGAIIFQLDSATAALGCTFSADATSPPYSEGQPVNLYGINFPAWDPDHNFAVRLDNTTVLLNDLCTVQDENPIAYTITVYDSAGNPVTQDPYIRDQPA